MRGRRWARSLEGFCRDDDDGEREGHGNRRRARLRERLSMQAPHLHWATALPFPDICKPLSLSRMARPPTARHHWPSVSILESRPPPTPPPPRRARAQPRHVCLRRCRIWQVSLPSPNLNIDRIDASKPSGEKEFSLQSEKTRGACSVVVVRANLLLSSELRGRQDRAGKQLPRAGPGLDLPANHPDALIGLGATFIISYR